jgi:M6 family metalloprotease-like protein
MTTTQTSNWAEPLIGSYAHGIAHRKTASLGGSRRLVTAAVSFVLTVLLLLGVVPRERADAGGDTLVPLYSWYSSLTGFNDNMATSDPAWRSNHNGERRGAYGFDRVIGSVFSPLNPQPPGTRPLYRWWNTSRKDQFTTSDPTWRPGTVHPGYTYVRLEGYVLSAPAMGTRPLTSWWSADWEDNFLTSNPAWRPGTVHPGYVFVRTEGHVVSPPGGDLPEFHVGTMTPRLLNSDANPVPAIGSRPLLVARLNYSDRPVARSRGEIEQFVFGPAPAFNVNDWFAENSHGVFRWRRVVPDGVVDLEYPGTRAQAAAAGNAAIGGSVIALAAAGVDLCRFDVRGASTAVGAPTGDGKLTVDELGIIWFGAAAADESWGQVQPAVTPYPVPVTTASGRCAVYGATAGVAENASLTLVAHELSHQLGTADIYGACECMSAGMSVMSNSNPAGDNATFHLDPFTKIRLGWEQPRVYALRDPGGSARLLAAQGHSGAAREPVLLYDPRRGPTEYFLLEYRSRTPGGYDADMFSATPGLAVWYVKTDTNGNPLTTPSHYVPGKEDVTDWIVGSPPDDWAPGFEGESTLWTGTTNANSWAVTCSFCLTWGGGSDTLLRFRVGRPRGADQSLIDVEWATGRTTSAPRLDQLRGNIVAPGGYLTIQGDFGVARDTKIVSLVSGARRHDLRVAAWSAELITVQIPAAVPAGRYHLRIYTDSTRTTASNPLPFTVTD